MRCLHVQRLSPVSCGWRWSCQDVSKTIWVPRRPRYIQVCQDTWMGRGLMTFIVHKIRSDDKRSKPLKGSSLHLPMAVYNHTLTPFKMTYLCQTSASPVRWEHGTPLYPCLSTIYNVASINVSEVHLSLWVLISVLPQAALLRKPEV